MKSIQKAEQESETILQMKQKREYKTIYFG